MVLVVGLRLGSTTLCACATIKIVGRVLAFPEGAFFPPRWQSAGLFSGLVHKTLAPCGACHGPITRDRAA